MSQRIQSSTRKSKNSFDAEYLDACETEDEGFTEGGIVIGKVLSAFNFGTGEGLNDNNISSIHTPAQEKLTGLFNMQHQSFATAPRCKCAVQYYS